MNEDTIRVLVVDDDREDWELVEDLLRDAEIWEVEAVWAPTYERGLELLRSDGSDVCLLDYRLGARSGIDFLREPAVRTSRTPVILMTGGGTAEVDRMAWEAGAADYLPKGDLTGPGLERAIRYAVERRRRRRAEARFRALVGNARELVSVLDEEGTLLYVSPSLSRILGFDPEEKVGEASLAEVHPDDRPKLEEVLRRVLQDPDQEYRLQYRVRHADGSWRVLDTLARNRLDDPDVAGIVVSSWDVTERVEHEERIRFQAELLDAVGQAVIATDMDGEVVYWNRAATEIYGWSEDEALGRPIVEVTVPDASRGQAEEILEAMHRGEPWTGEFEVRRKDGSRFPALVTNAPILDSDGRQIGIVGVSSDIGPIKETEFDLGERVKELRTLYLTTRILHEQETPLEERLQRFVEVLPPGWLYPDVTEARLTLSDATYETEGFRETPWRLAAEVPLEDSATGRLEVVLTEERPERDEGPFLREERELVENLAGGVGEALERDRLTRHLTQTISNLEEAVLVIDSREDGRTIQSVNPAAERIFGYSADEMVGRTTEFLHVSPESFRRFGEEGSDALESEGVFHASYPLRRKDGSTFQAEQAVSFLDPAKGLDGGAVSVVRDVSEAAEARAELEASEERFRELAERIEHVFWIHSPAEERLEYVSPAYETIWGRDPEELYERPSKWLEAVHPEDRERVRDAAPDPERDLEYRIVRPDGELRWIHDRAFPVRGEDGELRRVVGVAEDVTERKAAEERLSVLTREISDVIYIVDRGGTVRFTTPSVEEATGYTRAEFEGMNAFDFVHEEDRERVREQLEEIAGAPGATARGEYRVLDSEGEVIHVESVARNLLDHPGIEGILVASRDVTERAELERTLRETQRLEAIGRLAGGVAHDFNNLLTVIRSQTDLLLLDLEATHPARPEVEVIQSAADRAAELTNQLLTFSREQVLRPRVVDLGEVVRDAAGLLRRVIGEDIEVVLELPDGLPPVEVDPGQLEQVVVNLSINARDAMPGGGVLTLETDRADVVDGGIRSQELEPRAYTVLKVSDTGAGIPEEIQTRIFEPFFSTKRERGGTGLGLATAYGFMKQSGGSIEVESAPDEGTTFTLWFPATDGTVERSGPRSAVDLSKAPSSGTILLIEDDASVRRVTAKILERSGLEVVPTADAEAGLRVMESGRPVACVLTDLVLPGISGREVVDRVREKYPGTPLVVMSGYAADSPGHRGDLPAEIPFIQKPFTPEALLETVREAMAAR